MVVKHGLLHKGKNPDRIIVDECCATSYRLKWGPLHKKKDESIFVLIA